MNTKETRCTAAIQYRKSGANCAQSLLAAFSDILNITEAQALAMGAGLGGGVRSGNICGAVNAPVMILGCAFPEAARDKARAAYLAKEFQRRFTERFQYLNCRELLSHKDLRPTELALSLAGGDHCGLLIVSAAEILCDMMETERKRA